jgi:Secretion system C-terminal sorting domain
MKKVLLAIAAVASLTTSSYAQKMSEICGTTDWHLIDQRLIENRRAMEAGVGNENRSMSKFIPIKFHLIAKNDGSGRLSEAKVFENLCQLNKDYQDQNIIFYMADGSIDYINNTSAYDNQGTGLGAAALQAKYHKNAINVYFGESTPSPSSTGGGGLGGTTLGYYSPTKDWLVIRNDQVNSTSGTLSHEFGHHFSLAHPFKGWDQTSYLQRYGTPASNPVWSSIPTWFKTPHTVAPDGATLIECFNGSNCATAGDRVCDTPADYNFGFGWPGCSPFNRKLIGPCAADSIKDVMEENFMAYFIGCKNYIFTPEQKKLILADYNSAGRAKLRSNYAPAIETIANHATGLTPGSTSSAPMTAYYDFVELSWNPVAGADAYLVEVDRISSFNTSTTIRGVVTGNSFLLSKKLEANKSYYWRVIPFDSEGGTCLDPSTATKMRFTASSFVLGAKDIDGLNKWTVSPNPVAQGQSLFVDMSVATSFEAKVSLYNSIGQEMQTIGNQSIAEGQTRLTLATNNLSQGVYFIRVESAKGTETKRVVIE